MSQAAVKLDLVNSVDDRVHNPQIVFDGGGLDFIGTGLLAWVITVCSLGLFTPWAICLYFNWEAKHTIINGRRMGFHGKALGLFGLWVKIWFFSLITLGIYGFWAYPELRKWIAKNSSIS